MVSFIIWANNIKNDGIVKFLKNYINPMNIISDLSQPLSMSFRHFSNISVGTIISTILYTALSGLSAVLIGLVSRNGWMMSILVLAIGFALALLWARPAKKIMRWIIAGVTIVLGLFGLLESMGILSQVPVFTYGIPAVLSVYFDFFSGFIQALVFTLLSMVYIGISQPEPAKAEAE
jgi:F-type H+-transporting ATPase subunit a